MHSRKNYSLFYKIYYISVLLHKADGLINASKGCEKNWKNITIDMHHNLYAKYGNDLYDVGLY